MTWAARQCEDALTDRGSQWPPATIQLVQAEQAKYQALAPTRPAYGPETARSVRDVGIQTTVQGEFERPWTQESRHAMSLAGEVNRENSPTGRHSKDLDPNLTRRAQMSPTPGRPRQASRAPILAIGGSERAEQWSHQLLWSGASRSRRPPRQPLHAFPVSSSPKPDQACRSEHSFTLTQAGLAGNAVSSPWWPRSTGRIYINTCSRSALDPAWGSRCVARRRSIRHRRAARCVAARQVNRSSQTAAASRTTAWCAIMHSLPLLAVHAERSGGR